MTSAPPDAAPQDAAVVRALVDDLTAWAPRSPVLEALRTDYLDHLAGGGTTQRDARPEHVTASTFVLTPDHRHVLLCFHRKGRFWVQLGGHVEPTDGSVAEAAAREAREESGLPGLALASARPVDLDRHGLGDGFGRCAVHRDVGYVAVAPLDSAPTASDESEDVAWWPVDALPDDVPAGFPGRLSRVLAELG